MRFSWGRFARVATAILAVPVILIIAMSAGCGGVSTSRIASTSPPSIAKSTSGTSATPTLAPSASPAPARWFPPTLIAPVFLDVTLGSVSCASSSFCIVGVHDGTVEFNGHSWNVPASSALAYRDNWEVSCPSSAFCGAVDAYGDAYIYTAGVWSTAQDIAGDSSGLEISCGLPSFCLAIDEDRPEGAFYTYNGTSWSAPSTVPGFVSQFAGGDGNSSVACASSSLCVAMNGDGAFVYASGTWSAREPLEAGEVTYDVSCTQPSFCLAVSNTGSTYGYRGNGWVEMNGPPNLSQRPGATVLSCAGASFCTLIDNVNDAYVFDGTSWSAGQQIEPGTTNSILSLSCPTESFCMAVDSSGNAVRYSGM